MHRKTGFITIVLILTLQVFSLIAQADFFQYTDQNGTVVIVDDEGKIPDKFRKQTRQTKDTPDGGSKTTAVKVKNSQVFVPVRFNYRNTTVDTWLLLDTGATTTMISSGLADRLGIKPSSTQSHLSLVADGRVVQLSKTNVDYIAVGPKIKHGVTVTIMPSDGPGLGFDGLLGMNFLEEFPYRLDMKTHVIEWQQ
jgi:predicted aspartyl protease